MAAYRWVDLQADCLYTEISTMLSTGELYPFMAMDAGGKI